MIRIRALRVGWLVGGGARDTSVLGGKMRVSGRVIGGISCEIERTDLVESIRPSLVSDYPARTGVQFQARLHASSRYTVARQRDGKYLPLIYR